MEVKTGSYTINELLKEIDVAKSTNPISQELAFTYTRYHLLCSDAYQPDKRTKVIMASFIIDTLDKIVQSLALELKKDPDYEKIYKDITEGTDDEGTENIEDYDFNDEPDA